MTFPRPFSGYTLAGPLGAGGMGEVFLALTATGEPCVIKRRRVTSAASGDPAQAAGQGVLARRWQREVQVVQRLEHPGLPRTLEVGQADGEPFLVQQLVPGLDLVDLGLRKLDVAGAVHLACRLAEILSYIHESSGLVHRDVAPRNVRIGLDGRVFLLDFGLARGLDDSALTAPTQSFGRKGYDAPELWVTQPDRRADIFSLGVVTWELLAGIRAPEQGPLPPIVATIPAALRSALEQATAESRSDRPPTAGAFLAALEPFASPNAEGSAALAAIVSASPEYQHEARAIEQMLAEARASGAGNPNPGPSVAVSYRGSQDASATLALNSPSRHRLLLGLAIGLLGILTAALITQRTRSPSSVSLPTAQAPRDLSPAATPVSPSPLPSPAPPPPALPLPAPLPTATPSAPPAPVAPLLKAAVPAPPPNASTSAARLVPAERRTSAAPTLAASRVDRSRASKLLEAAQERFDHGELDEAERLAREALKKGAGAEGYYLLGVLRSTSRDLAGARSFLEQALSADPNHRQAAALLEELGPSGARGGAAGPERRR